MAKYHVYMTWNRKNVKNKNVVKQTNVTVIYDFIYTWYVLGECNTFTSKMNPIFGDDKFKKICYKLNKNKNGLCCRFYYIKVILVLLR